VRTPSLPSVCVCVCVWMDGLKGVT